MTQNNYKYYLPIIVVSILLCAISCTPKSDTNFSIKGKIKNINSTYFLCAKEITSDSIVVDTIHTNAKGEFSYKGKIDTLSILSFYFASETLTPIFVDKDWHIEIEGDIESPNLIEIKGGEINDDITKFKKDNKKLFESKNEIITALQKATDNNQTAHTDLKNVNFELVNAAREYIKRNPSKIASVVLIESFYKDNTSVESLENELKLLTGAAAKFPLTEELRKYSTRIKQSQEGAQAADFTLKNLKGKDVKLSDFKGKYVVLSFGAFYCPLCQAENPFMQDVYAKTRKSKHKVDFVTILLDSDKELITDEATKPFQWTLLFDGKSWASEVIDLYNIIEIPYNILISPEGTILERNLPIGTLMEKLDKLEEK